MEKMIDRLTGNMSFTNRLLFADRVSQPKTDRLDRVLLIGCWIGIPWDQVFLVNSPVVFVGPESTSWLIIRQAGRLSPR